MPPAMRLKLFGNPQLTANGAPIRLSQRAYHILTRIALLRGGRIDRRVLIEGLWPDLDGEAAFSALRRELYRIDVAWRDAGNASPLVNRDRRLLAFDGSSALSIDALEFEAQCASGRFEEAAACYCGELFPTCDDVEVGRERQRFAMRIAEVLERLIDQAHLAGRTADAIGYARRLQTFDPYREQTIRTIMQLLSDAGDRTAALRTYRSFETLIESELGAKPLPATVALSRKLADAGASDPAKHGRLPTEQASFVGREHDVAQICSIFDRRRLITITGPPGMGKSRLATHVARLHEPDVPGCAYFVDLTNAANAEDVERIVLEAFAGDSAPGVALPETHIAGLEAFVVIDNCEHVFEACVNLVQRILDASPASKILATSRRPLHLAAELEWRLAPLELPAAVRLFLERAERVRPSAIAAAPMATASAICTLLDGVPLALELAASRLRLTTFAELERLLLARDPVVTRRATSGRHATEAPYAWSYALLTERAQRAFRNLAAFSDGFTFDAARTVCAGDDAGEVIDALQELVDRSMIVPVAAGEHASRYKLLFSAHQYALELLDESGEAGEVRRRHSRYFMEQAASLSNHLVGPRRAQVHAALRLEGKNILVALDRAIRNGDDVLRGLETCVSLARYWTDAFLNREGLALIEAALQRLPEDAAPRAAALQTASVLARQSGEIPLAISYAEAACERLARGDDALAESRALAALGNAYTIVREFEHALAAGTKALSIARSLRSEEAEVFANMMLAQARLSMGNVHEARELFARAVDLATALGLVREALIALNNLAMCALLEDDYACAETYAASALDRGRTLMLPENVAWALSALASVTWHRGDVRAALTLTEEVITAARMVDARILEIRLLEDVAKYLIARGDSRSGASLFGAVDAARTQFDQPLQPIEETPRAAIDARIQAILGSNAYEAARSTGTMLALDDALARALATARTSYSGDMALPPPRLELGAGMKG